MEKVWAPRWRSPDRNSEVRMKHSILIVEDNPSVATPLAEYLELAGYEVRIARSAHEAKSAISGKSFSLIVTDLRMESGRDEDGLDLVRHVHNAKPGLPVFVLTASGSPDSAAEVVRLDVQKFLPKPISLPKLLGTVNDFVRQFYAGLP